MLLQHIAPKWFQDLCCYHAECTDANTKRKGNKDFKTYLLKFYAQADAEFQRKIKRGKNNSKTLV